MRTPPEERKIAAGGERRELLSELFHALNQPLTTLRCALELALQRPHSQEECRHSMQAALQQAESITRLTCGLRELLEADDFGAQPQVVALDSLVREAVLDWMPVAEAAQVTLVCQELAPCPVQFEVQRLRQALFHLLEFALHFAAGSATVKLDLAQQGSEVLLSVATSQKDISGAVDSGCADLLESKMEQVQRKLGMAIARSIFAAAGGSLEVRGGKELRLEIRLALVEHPAEAEQHSSGRSCAIQA